MNARERTALQVVLDYLTDTVRPGHTNPPRHGEAHNALVFLAAQAYDGQERHRRTGANPPCWHPQVLADSLAETWTDRMNDRRLRAEVERLRGDSGEQK